MGVFGIIGNEKTNVASSVYYGLYALQHRGQESCGISVNDDGVIHTYKDTGLVNDVFTTQKLESLGQGTMAIGHVRYGTMGTKGRVNAEPLVVNHTKGHLAIATNGRLVNGSVLKQELELNGMIFHTSSDAEIVSYVVIQERLKGVSIEQAVNKAMDKLKGGFCMLLMSPKKIIAVRDE
jgi:amidophosphoribosyltransferase